MGASYEPRLDRAPAAPLYDVYVGRSATLLPYSYPTNFHGPSVDVALPLLHKNTSTSREPLQGFALQLVQDRADIEINGSEFNFVRSIRVFDVRYVRQPVSGRDGDCNWSAVVSLSTYATQ